MICGKFYLENYANWQISYYLIADELDAAKILRKLSSLGCSKKFKKRATELLGSGKRNIGLAYSKPNLRASIIVVSQTTNIWEFFNSFAHELDHIEKHIAKALGFSPYSEDASYLVGEFVRNMLYTISTNLHIRNKLC